MDGPQTGTGNLAGSPQAENLDAVLGRFQNWAKTQRVKSGDATPLSTKLPAEAREISYEQALRASSYRRAVNSPADFVYLGQPPREINPTASARIHAAPLPAQSAPKDPPAPPRVDTAPSNYCESESESLNPRRPEVRFTAAAQAIAQAEAAPEAAPGVPPILASPRARKKSPSASALKAKSARTSSATPPAMKPLSEKSRKPRKSATQAKAADPAGIATIKVEGRGTGSGSGRAKVGVKIGADEIAEPGAPPQLSQDLDAEAGFPQALQRAIALTNPRPTPNAPAQNITVERASINRRSVNRRSVNRGSVNRGSINILTLRISDQEKSRLEANAANLNLSLNDYLMQCALRPEQPASPHRAEPTDLSESIFLRQYALGVDELQEQMKLALARPKHPQNVLPPIPTRRLSTLPAIFARFALHSLRRFRKTSSEIPSAVPREVPE